VFEVFMTRPGRGVAAVAACLALTAQAAGLASANTPVPALADDLAFTDSSPAPRALAFATARRAGARVVRITLDWSLVAPEGAAKPAGFDAADPSAPGYRWGYIEDAVRDAARARLRVVLVVSRAPAWAEGPGRPSDAPPGAWQPDPAELGAFVRAAARRFSGFYPDPKDAGDGLTTPGRSLPRVRLWQLWEAPNGGATLRPIEGAADHYREMLNAASSALRRVSGGNVLVTGGTTDDGAIAPLAFWRRLLCLSPACPRKPHFNVAAHDPLSRRAPGARPHAGQFGIIRLGRLRHLAGKPVWVTSTGWETPPVNPRGVPPATQARYLSEAIYRADRARVALVAWNGLQDRASYLSNFPSIASGLFFNRANDLTRDAPKPALRAYRFPFVVTGARAWGVAPRGRAPVRIDKRGARGWRRTASVQASPSGEFSVPVRARGVYRARQAGVRSLPWRTG
jgi:hypothetical protein